MKAEKGVIGMKVLMLNGSPHAKGCTYTALHEMEKIFRQEGISCELIQVGQEAVRGCIACGQCRKLGRCVFTTDSVNLVLEKWENADALILGSPVYYASRQWNIYRVSRPPVLCRSV